MDRLWILSLLTLALAESSVHPRGIFVNLYNGELCLNSLQCRSSCCHRKTGLSFARCANKAAENEECSLKSLYGVYYKCPCERGLICEADRTIVGSIVNSDFGICKDRSRKISSDEKERKKYGG